ncbi:MAG TPA: metallophosphoesterase [Coxiellaceae bacterium]|nr:MAG: serine/threonine protein phosphatase [Gammaproteobacteria bacterium RIFCSPHIGHO2_12_FULL_36_30]HLB56559.1 metallophosphoesterase [Coxiellaceae bacterium]
MKLTWLTDIHINFLDQHEREIFYQKIIDSHCDRVLISGDIAEANSVVELLIEMETYIKKQIYFVLGNHDYYRGQIKKVYETVTKLTKNNNQLCWLSISGIQLLTKDTILVGQDGWADGRLGDYTNSTVSLNDSRLIADLFQAKILGKFKLLEKMQTLADADAKKLQHDLQLAINKNPKKIIVLTHIPPFKEACLYEGKISDDDWIPYFSSKASGDVLMKIAKGHSLIEFLVLCGHTHGEANYQALPNLIVRVGKAEYFQPRIEEIITV